MSIFNFNKEMFGLNISDFSIEIISLSGQFQNSKLSALARIELPSGILKDGEILNKEELTNLLRGLISNPKFGKIKNNKFIFSVSEAKSFISIFEIEQNKSSDEILELIKSTISQFFPFSFSEIYFDFKRENSEIFLMAAPKDFIDDYLDLFKKCQIEPLAIEPESLSLGRSLIADKKEPILIADIGAKISNFSLFEEGKMKLSISNPIAGEEFTRQISEKLKISLTEAEKTKKDFGLNPEKEEGRVFLILQEKLQELIKEIKRMEDYLWQKSNKKIERIILVGGSALLPYLAEYFFDNSGIKVETADPWVNINIDILRKKEYFREALGVEPILYATVIGAALRGLERNPKDTGINLMKGVK